MGDQIAQDQKRGLQLTVWGVETRQGQGLSEKQPVGLSPLPGLPLPTSPTQDWDHRMQMVLLAF